MAKNEDLTAADELHDALVRHQIYLLRYSGTLRNKVVAELNRTEARLRDLILARFPNIAKNPKKTEALIRNAIATRAPAWSDSSGIWRSDLRGVVDAEPLFMIDAFNRVLPTTMLPKGMAPSTTDILARNFEGKNLTGWLTSLRNSDSNAIATTIRTAVTHGDSAVDAATRLIGTSAAQGRDGALQVIRNSVASLTRTSVVGLTNEARSETYLANPNIVTGEKFVAVLDGRTTPICKALDSKNFDVGDGPQPPLHIGCRSVRVPILDDEEIGNRNATPIFTKRVLREFTDANGLDAVASRDDLPFGTKGDFDAFRREQALAVVGKEPVTVGYGEWLGRQSVQFQNDVLGVTKGRLFRDGGLGVEAFADRVTYQPVTLAELARSDADAFRAAGLDPADFL